MRPKTLKTVKTVKFLLGQVSKSGVHYLKKWFIAIPWTLLMVTNAFISSYFDHVVWEDNPADGIKTTQDSWVLIFLYIVPLILILTAQVFFCLTRRQVEEKIIRKRILLFILGFVSIIIGIIIFAVPGILEHAIGYIDPIAEYSTWIAASIFWAVGPVIMVIGSPQKCNVPIANHFPIVVRIFQNGAIALRRQKKSTVFVEAFNGRVRMNLQAAN